MPTPPGMSQKDGNQVLRAVMDDDTNRLRVDAVISPDGHDLEIHYQDDSIAIGDPASDNILAINPDGSIKADIIGSVDVNINGLTEFQTSQYTINTSAIQLASTPLVNRSGISIKAHNTTNAIVYIGNSAGVTTSTGYALFDGDSVSLDLTGASQIWAIGSSPGQIIYVMEIGD